MVKVYFDKDIDMRPIQNKTVSVIGYGNQGRAQALNLRDSGVNVIIGGIKDETWKQAERDGFRPMKIEDAAKQGDVVQILIPDMEQPPVYKKEIERQLADGKALGFSHGFNILYRQIVPPPFVDVIMVAPKSPGARLRETYQAGFGVPALIAVEQDHTKEAKATALAYCKAIGCAKAGAIETTFKDETESDLIGEQIVLVGGLMELIRNGFETLVEAGYPSELSYFEACNEAKLIMDLIYERGMNGMLRAVSNTAKYGGIVVGPQVIDAHARENMKKIVDYVRSGKFAQDWINSYRKDPKFLEREMKKWEKHTLETTGKFIRKMSGLEK